MHRRRPRRDSAGSGLGCFDYHAPVTSPPPNPQDVTLLMNAGLLEYHSASTLESPPIEPILVESNDPEGPFGAKEAGEGSLAAVIPAVSNAIYDAVGVWITSLPITPEKVLKAIKEKQKSEIRTQNLRDHYSDF